MFSINQTLQNRYRITGEFGQIGAGHGYTAFDSILGKSVVIKETLIDSNDTTPSLVPSTVRHQSLLCADDQFTEADRSYAVIDDIDGQTLGELLEKNRAAFPISEVALWAEGLLDALNHLHSQDPPLIHSNIKPQNIKLASGGNVKLIVLYANCNEPAIADNMTFDASVLGYLPIEQIWLGLDVGSRKVIRSGYDERSAEILEMPLDVQSDVYSIGATIYHLLTGRIPVDALTRSIDMLEGKPDPIAPASKLNPSVPSKVSDVLTRAMQIHREDRYGSASIMRQVLRSALSGFKGDAKQSEAPALFEDDSFLELPPMRPVRQREPATDLASGASRQPEAQSGMQSAESHQLELIKRQLREAETRRVEAEQRAADAEKKLLEHQTMEFKVPDPLPVDNARAPLPEFSLNDADREAVEDSFELFETRPDGGRWKAKAAGIGALLLVLAAAGWGISSFMSDVSVENAPAKLDSPTASLPVPEPNPVAQIPTASNDAVPAPTAEIVVETETTAADTAARTKSTPTPAQQAKKQPAPTPKTNPPPKKSVTLDDLLKDN